MSLTLIEAYTHCPLCGSAEYTFQSGTRQCADCGHRDFDNPITAVAVWILDCEDRVLLIRRAKEPAKDKLAPPGGFVDPGESLEEAAQRELKEEIGLEVSDFRYVSSDPNAYRYNGLARPVCDVFFTCRVDNFNVVIDETEVSAWQMRPLADIDPEELAFDSMRASLEALKS